MAMSDCIDCWDTCSCGGDYQRMIDGGIGNQNKVIDIYQAIGKVLKKNGYINEMPKLTEQGQRVKDYDPWKHLGK